MERWFLEIIEFQALVDSEEYEEYKEALFGRASPSLNSSASLSTACESDEETSSSSDSDTTSVPIDPETISKSLKS